MDEHLFHHILGFQEEMSTHKGLDGAPIRLALGVAAHGIYKPPEQTNL
jgi:hypothetical protein